MPYCLTAQGWGGELCALDVGLVTGSHFVCVCNAIGSLDLVVIEKKAKVPKSAVRLAEHHRVRLHVLPCDYQVIDCGVIAGALRVPRGQLGRPATSGNVV